MRAARVEGGALHQERAVVPAWIDGELVIQRRHREVMELFTMGVGNYSAADVREAARAFTGWNLENLDFVGHPTLHDEDPKTFLGQTGNFDGVDVIKIILEQHVTAEYIAGKIYRFFVREDLSPALQTELGAIFRDHNYELRPLLETIFRSRDFYSQATYGHTISRGQSNLS